MQKIKQFLYYKEMNSRDFWFCISLLFLPIGIILMPLNPKISVIFSMVILYIACLLANYFILENSQERYESLPKDYKKYVALIIGTITGCLIFIVAVVNNLDDTSEFFYLIVVIFAFTTIAYLICLGIIAKAISTYIYYWALKKFFVFEDSTEKQFISRDDLSKYITINDQVKFFNTVIVNFVVNFVLVVYVYLGFITIINSYEAIIKILINFAKKYSIASFGNTIGFISLVITIYTVTYSTQRKIYEKAVEAFKEKVGD